MIAKEGAGGANKRAGYDTASGAADLAREPSGAGKPIKQETSDDPDQEHDHKTRYRVCEVDGAAHAVLLELIFDTPGLRLNSLASE